VSAERTRARVFGEVADLYDRRRPGYPAALYDELLALVGRRARALEAGAGTGKATVELARRGVEVVAFEPDQAMAAVARRAAAGLSVQVEEQPFEEWRGEAGSFDLVVSAQAWHWIDPERGPAVARRALRPGGVLGVWWSQAGDWDGPVRAALDAAYERHAQDLAGSVVNSPAHPLSPDPLVIEGFEAMEPHNYTWAQRYDAASYCELLQTHSDHRLLSRKQLGELLLAVSEVIEHVGDGEITYPYSTTLLTARRSDSR
jgi:SAM-dependent methyltransferase